MVGGGTARDAVLVGAMAGVPVLAEHGSFPPGDLLQEWTLQEMSPSVTFPRLELDSCSPLAGILMLL